MIQKQNLIKITETLARVKRLSKYRFKILNYLNKSSRSNIFIKVPKPIIFDVVQVATFFSRTTVPSEDFLPLVFNNIAARHGILHTTI